VSFVTSAKPRPGRQPSGHVATRQHKGILNPFLGQVRLVLAPQDRPVSPQLAQQQLVLTLVQGKATIVMFAAGAPLLMSSISMIYAWQMLAAASTAQLARLVMAVPFAHGTADDGVGESWPGPLVKKPSRVQWWWPMPHQLLLLHRDFCQAQLEDSRSATSAWSAYL
jgi:hypothetical protein